MLTEPSDRTTSTIGSTLADGPEVTTSELALGGMHCNACATRIERVLAKQDGVLSASVNLATHRAFVSFESSATTVDDLRSAVNGIGYTASLVEHADEKELADDPDHWVVRAAASWPLALIALGVALLGPEDALAGWIVLLLAIVVEVVGGWPFLRTSARLLRHGATSMDTLIAVGTLAALAVSAVEAIALGGRHVHLGGSGAFAARLHGVMAPLIVSILATGRAVEARARGRAAAAMHSMLSLRPPTARLVTSAEDEEGTVVSPESVPVGALVRVRPAEVIPLDGIVRAGWSAVDESMLTGEPMPVEHGPDSFVTGGTRNGHSPLLVEVTAVASESVLARLQRLVEEAQRDKPPLQRIADRISAVFVPIVLLGSLATFLVWWLAAGNLGTAVLAAVAVLLVACPCAMGLATPVAMMVGTGRAASLGILVRSGDALERLARVDTAAFDKTGTLTERHATVTDVVAVPPITKDKVLALAAAVEAEADHPIASAIREAAADSPGGVPKASDVKSIPGFGVSGFVNGSAVTAGRLENVELPDALSPFLSERQARGETIVAVQRDGFTIGVISLNTPTRPEAAAAVTRLHEMGISTVVMSGDEAAAVDTISRSLSIDDARSGLPPAGKLDVLRSLQDDGRSVVMVGDGVNDAPALAAADVGCAIGSGTEAALDNSDVALLGSDLHGVPTAIAIAGSTSATITQNFGWALGYNIAALPLAAAGLLDPLVAAVAMGVSSLVVVMNSLRLLRLGRSGIEHVRSPTALRGVRAFVLSLAVPVTVFAGATVAAQAVSPAKGQPLLPSLPSITTVALAHGGSAEFYLEPGRPGINQLHLILTGPWASGPRPDLAASRNGSTPRPERLARIAPGHYFSVANLPSGDWRFAVSATLHRRHANFAIERVLS